MLMNNLLKVVAFDSLTVGCRIAKCCLANNVAEFQLTFDFYHGNSSVPRVVKLLKWTFNKSCNVNDSFLA